MILTVEDAILERLRRGLGRSIKTVEPYGGQFDEAGLSHVMGGVPALYVHFAGHKNPKPKNTAGDVLQVPATFVIYVVVRNVSSESAGRRGTAREVGAYQLIEAVRHLLGNQDFGLAIDAFKVGPVQLLGNVKVGNSGLTAYGCSFDTHWVERLATAQGLPRRGDPVFEGLGGERSDDEPDFLRVGLMHDVEANGSVDVVDVVQLRSI